MKNHVMNLNPSPFEMIKSGRKTIELRLLMKSERKLKWATLLPFEYRGFPKSCFSKGSDSAQV